MMDKPKTPWRKAGRFFIHSLFLTGISYSARCMIDTLNERRWEYALGSILLFSLSLFFRDLYMFGEKAVFES